MADDEIVLHFELAEGQYADTLIIADALIKWVALVQQAALAIDPSDKIQLEIIGNEKGSLRFPQILRFVDRGMENLDKAWSEYPHLKRAVIGSAHVFATGVVGGLITAGMQPDVQKVKIVNEAEKLARQQMEEKVATSPGVQSATREFYQTVEREKAITGVGVAQDRDSKPDLIIPRSEFQTRSGLWVIEQDVERDRLRIDEWDVVLLKAPFSHRRLRWQFSRDGLPFSAVMHDAQFLAAVKDGRVPINLQEGVIMRIQIESVEELKGQVWKTVPRSRRVIRVISPEPLSPTALANNPRDDQ